MSSLGDKLKELRIENHLSKERLARQLFTSPSTISRWEKGEKTPSVEELERIRKFYGLTNIENLLSLIPFDEDTKKPEETPKKEDDTDILAEITEDIAQISNKVQAAGDKGDSQEAWNLDKELRKQIRIRWIIIVVFVLLVVLFWVLYRVERYYNSYEYLEGRPMEAREGGG